MAKLDWTKLGWNAALLTVATTFAACQGEAPEAEDPAAAPVEEETEAPAAEETAAAGTAMAEIEAFIASQTIDKSADGWKTNLPKPSLMTRNPRHWKLLTSPWMSLSKNL